MNNDCLYFDVEMFYYIYMLLVYINAVFTTLDFVLIFQVLFLLYHSQRQNYLYKRMFHSYHNHNMMVCFVLIYDIIIYKNKTYH